MKTNSENTKKIQGGITAPLGFLAGSVKAGIKYSRPDIAMILSERPARTAALFTRNIVKGDHIPVCRKHLSNSTAQAVIINSGCANACVGPAGLRDAERMTEICAEAAGLNPSDVLVCSTGTIGIPMPMHKIEPGIKAVSKVLRRNGGASAARAIMTTDTRPKQYALEFKAGGAKIRIGGMAKGSGMIEPNMATMLAFLTTDANVDARALKKALREAVDSSFNRISVDGDQSCNDTVILMANAAASSELLNEKHADWTEFCSALRRVCHELAVMIVKDGEGATKFVKVAVTNARNNRDAERAVRAVANSLLVKTSWFGCDPNWGRIIDAVGYSGAAFNPSLTSIRFDGVPVVKSGRRSDGVSLKALEAIYRKKSFEVEIDIAAGKASAFVFTCDCSFDYVKINSEYMT